MNDYLSKLLIRSLRTCFDVIIQDLTPFFRLHPLHGKLEGLHSVSINLSYRITLELLIKDEQIIPVTVGDHDAVY